MEKSGSPITISSSKSFNSSFEALLEYNSSKCNSVITIESSDIDKMHLGWEKRHNSSNCKTPDTQICNIQKVADWIKSIEKSCHDVNNPEQIQLVYDSDNEKLNETQHEETEGFVVVRCDYMKHFSSNHNSNVFNANQPISNKQIQKSNKNAMSNMMVSSTNVERHSKLKPNKLTNLADKMSVSSSADKESICYSMKPVFEKSEDSSNLYEIPKSIESKKKELCTYLKLMDPSDKKEILALQNRRSTRVRNLAALQEKKEQEKKIKESVSVKCNVNKSEQLLHLVDSKQKKNEMYFKNSGESKQSTNDNKDSSDLSAELEKNTEENEKYAEQQNEFLHEKDQYLTMKSYEDLHIQQMESPDPIVNDVQNLSFSEVDLEVIKQPFYFPFPPKKLTVEIEHFDNVMKKFIPKFETTFERKIRKKSLLNTTFPTRSLSKNKENIQCIENNHEKKIENVKMPSYSNSVGNNMGKQSEDKVPTKQKFKNKIDFVMLKNKNQKMNNGKFSNLNNKLYNVKLRSAKFKIKLKRIPTKKEVLKNKRFKKVVKNSKVEKNIQQKNQTIVPMTDQKKMSLETMKINCGQGIEMKEKKFLKVVSQVETKALIALGKDKNVEQDFQNLMVDINDFNNLSEEHKKCLVESQIFLSTSVDRDRPSHIFPIPEEVPPLYGFSTSDVDEIKLMCEIFEQSILKHSQGPLRNSSEFNHNKESIVSSESDLDNKNEDDINLKKNSFNVSKIHKQKNINCSPPDSVSSRVSNNLFNQNKYLEINPNDVEENNCDILPYDKNVEMKSLQKSLQFAKKKNMISSPEMHNSQDWSPDESPRPKIKRLSHYIRIDRENGDILKAFYVDFNLVVCQEFIVSFWMQTPLGNVLGSQDMWIPRGYTQRLVLNNKCIQKESKEMVLCSETTVAYIELWTKEHKSDIRQGPVADIFITIYFWKQRQNGVDKKVLQLENINGFAEDVQYCVLKNSPKIIVSWYVASEENIPRRTCVHLYQLAPDYQVVSHISDIEPVNHYVSSLHNIEGCENLIVGSGENNITLWNVEYGYKIATIELSDIGSDLSTLWVKCDRGFLFAIQQCGTTELRLIAINGINHSWKKLASYFPSEGFDGLKGVCIENGLLLSFYEKGILCWRAETGEPVEEISMETDLIACGNYVIFLEEDIIFVRHSITHLLSMSVDEP